MARGRRELRLAELDKPVPGLPRLLLLESEYMAAAARAELTWLRAVAADLRAKRLTWSEAEIRRWAADWAKKHGASHES